MNDLSQALKPQQDQNAPQESSHPAQALTRAQKLEARKAAIEKELAAIRRRESEDRRAADIHIKCVFAGFLFEKQNKDSLLNVLHQITPLVAEKHQQALQELIDKVRQRN